MREICLAQMDRQSTVASSFPTLPLPLPPHPLPRSLSLLKNIHFNGTIVELFRLNYCLCRRRRCRRFIILDNHLVKQWRTVSASALGALQTRQN